ncbi:methyl-accepting chemotaxis protein [Roseomonas elaeocarpi]|uniref:Methyl-accepting chemotaxis protein n=1 Tax=Roseomonas elaeocarpi TaxID=907779 RepID=A0ABV6JPY9_9PROT
MRMFRNLSVGRKLAVSAALAALLIAALVLLVRREVQLIVGEEAVLTRTMDLTRRLGGLSASTAETPMVARDIAAAQSTGAVATGQNRAELALRNGAEIATAMAEEAPAGLREDFAALPALLTDYAAGIAQLADERTKLLRARDERFYAASAEFDQALEIILGSVEFETQSNSAATELRDRLLGFQSAINDVRFGLQRFLATGDADQVRRVRRAVALQRVQLREGLNVPMSDRIKNDIEAAGKMATTMIDGAVEVLRAGEAITALDANALSTARTKLMETTDRLSRVLAGNVAEADSRVSEATRRLQMLLLVIGGVAVLLLVVSSWLTARTISLPLRRLAASVAAIAEGNAGEVVRDTERRDEIGTIAQALERLRGVVGRAFAQGQMIEQLPLGIMTADPRDEFRITYLNAEMQDILGRVAGSLPCAPGEVIGQSFDMFHAHPERQRELLSDPSRLPFRTRMNLGGEVMELRATAITDGAGHYVGPMVTWGLVTEQVRLADTFEAEVGQLVEGVADRAMELRRAAGEVSTAAAGSGQQARQVAQVSQQASADVQAVAAAAEEMAVSVAEITERVSEAAAVAGRAVQEVQSTDATVRSLSESASRIGDVVRMISDIAGQTNLLALNATIEAARAGEAGKGFAVVASEVKSLASQTARATEEIAAQIQQMQGATAAAVTAIHGIGATVERTSEIATAIAAAVEEQGSTTREIARSAAEVARGTDVVTQSIGEVRQAAEDTGAAAAEMLGASGDLSDRAGALQQKSAAFLQAVRAA